MKTKGYKVKICIVGCGAIGSRIAGNVVKDLNKDCRITGLYDIDEKKSKNLEKRLALKGITKHALEILIEKSDCVVEAVNSDDTLAIVQQSLEAKKSVLVMSVGRLLQADYLFKLARKNNAYILLPSGAIAGVDAIKAASLVKVKEITLTTRKPPKGFRNNPYFDRKGIDLENITKETLLYDGNVEDAVKLFPQNINVAATIALACQKKTKIRIRILTAPEYKMNSHEIQMSGDFGTMMSRTDNVICPDNPKTSYLAALSGLQTLKQFCNGILIGT